MMQAWPAAVTTTNGLVAKLGVRDLARWNERQLASRAQLFARLFQWGLRLGAGRFLQSKPERVYLCGDFGDRRLNGLNIGIFIRARLRTHSASQFGAREIDEGELVHDAVR